MPKGGKKAKTVGTKPQIIRLATKSPAYQRSFGFLDEEQNFTIDPMKDYPRGNSLYGVKTVGEKPTTIKQAIQKMAQDAHGKNTTKARETETFLNSAQAGQNNSTPGDIYFTHKNHETIVISEPRLLAAHKATTSNNDNLLHQYVSVQSYFTIFHNGNFMLNIGGKLVSVTEEVYRAIDKATKLIILHLDVKKKDAIIDQLRPDNITNGMIAKTQEAILSVIREDKQLKSIFSTLKLSINAFMPVASIVTRYKTKLENETAKKVDEERFFVLNTRKLVMQQHPVDTLHAIMQAHKTQKINDETAIEQMNECFARMGSVKDNGFEPLIAATADKAKIKQCYYYFKQMFTTPVNKGFTNLIFVYGLEEQRPKNFQAIITRLSEEQHNRLMVPFDIKNKTLAIKDQTRDDYFQTFDTRGKDPDEIKALIKKAAKAKYDADVSTIEQSQKTIGENKAAKTQAESNKNLLINYLESPESAQYNDRPFEAFFKHTNGDATCLKSSKLASHIPVSDSENTNLLSQHIAIQFNWFVQTFEGGTKKYYYDTNGNQHEITNNEFIGNFTEMSISFKNKFLHEDKVAIINKLKNSNNIEATIREVQLEYMKKLREYQPALEHFKKYNVDINSFMPASAVVYKFNIVNQDGEAQKEDEQVYLVNNTKKLLIKQPTIDQLYDEIKTYINNPNPAGISQIRFTFTGINRKEVIANLLKRTIDKKKLLQCYIAIKNNQELSKEITTEEPALKAFDEKLRELKAALTKINHANQLTGMLAKLNTEDMGVDQKLKVELEKTVLSIATDPMLLCAYLEENPELKIRLKQDVRATRTLMSDKICALIQACLALNSNASAIDDYRERMFPEAQGEHQKFVAKIEFERDLKNELKSIRKALDNQPPRIFNEKFAKDIIAKFKVYAEKPKFIEYMQANPKLRIAVNRKYDDFRNYVKKNGHRADTILKDNKLETMLTRQKALDLLNNGMKKRFLSTANKDRLRAAKDSVTDANEYSEIENALNTMANQYEPRSGFYSLINFFRKIIGKRVTTSTKKKVDEILDQKPQA